MMLKSKKIFDLISLKKTNNTLDKMTPELLRKARLSKHICLHISEVSAVMVGICQSGVGLIHVATLMKKLDTYVDDFLALDSLIFLLACFTAYWAFRSPSIRRTLQIERVADSFFVVGFCVMVIVALLISYSSIKT